MKTAATPRAATAAPAPAAGTAAIATDILAAVKAQDREEELVIFLDMYRPDFDCPSLSDEWILSIFEADIIKELCLVPGFRVDV